MKFLPLFLFLFAALATAATNGPKGKGGAVFLKAQCKSDADCSKGKKGACTKKDEYLKILPAGKDRDFFACASAKVFDGVCGYADQKDVCACFPPDDAACSYLFECTKGPPLKGCDPKHPNKGQVPNAIIDDAGESVCACPAVCEAARAGFVKGPPVKDECKK